MSESLEPGTVEIISEPGDSTVELPEPGKLYYKSELFDVIIRSKHKQPGLFRERFVVAVELLEADPLVERIALLEIPEDVWRAVAPGEKCQARMYEQPNGSWLSKPPTVKP